MQNNLKFFLFIKNLSLIFAFYELNMNECSKIPQFNVFKKTKNILFEIQIFPFKKKNLILFLPSLFLFISENHH